jgi:site-specific recombinase XerD
MEREYPNIGPQETELKHLQHFLKKTVMGVVRDQEQRILKVSTQRRIISGVRAFFKYLIMEKKLWVLYYKK